MCLIRAFLHAPLFGLSSEMQCSCRRTGPWDGTLLTFPGNAPFSKSNQWSCWGPRRGDLKEAGTPWVAERPHSEEGWRFTCACQAASNSTRVAWLSAQGWRGPRRRLVSIASHYCYLCPAFLSRQVHLPTSYLHHLEHSPRKSSRRVPLMGCLP